MNPDFTKPVALLGGSFDPLHEGHLAVAKAVKKLLPEAQLVFVPACISPGKHPPWAPAELRLKWLRAVAGPEGMLVWDEEIRRGGESFTVDTLEAAHRLGAEKENLFFVTGSDAYRSLSRWKAPERIRQLCRLLVVARPGVPVELQGGDLLVPMEPHTASSTAIRAGLARTPPLTEHLPPIVRSDLEGPHLLSPNPYARKTE
jgi:nicotinate-nucleotide adenylyltransferase